jgi:hypothetical protein
MKKNLFYYFFILLFQNYLFAQSPFVEIKPPTPTTSGFYGLQIHSYQNLIIIGAEGESANGVKSGAAHIFEDKNGVWVNIANLSPFNHLGNAEPNNGAGMQFGSAVAIHGDYAIVGAPDADVKGVSSGAIFIFKNTNGQWLPHQKLVGHDSVAFDGFGSSLAINQQNIFVGSPKYYMNAGKVFNFELQNASWVAKPTKDLYNGSTKSSFGSSLAIENSTLVVGAPKEYWYSNNNTWIVDCGSINIYDVGTQMVHKKKIFLTELGDNARLGHKLAISQNRIVASAEGYVNNGVAFAGAAVVIKKSSNTPTNDQWIVEKIFKSSTPIASERFASRVALYGNDLILGTPNKYDYKGQVLRYKLTNNVWNLEETIQDLTSNNGQVQLGSAIHVNAKYLLYSIPFVQFIKPDGTKISKAGTYYAKRIHSLLSDVTQIGAYSNKKVKLNLNLGAQAAGKVFYFIGSTGLNITNQTFLNYYMPIATDTYFYHGINHGLSLSAKWGELDQQGKAQVEFWVPAGHEHNFANKSIYLAATIIDGLEYFFTNEIKISFTP